MQQRCTDLKKRWKKITPVQPPPYLDIKQIEVRGANSGGEKKQTALIKRNPACESLFSGRSTVPSRSSPKVRETNALNWSPSRDYRPSVLAVGDIREISDPSKLNNSPHLKRQGSEPSIPIPLFWQAATTRFSFREDIITDKIFPQLRFTATALAPQPTKTDAFGIPVFFFVQKSVKFAMIFRLLFSLNISVKIERFVGNPTGSLNLRSSEEFSGICDICFKRWTSFVYRATKRKTCKRERSRGCGRQNFLNVKR